MKKFENWLLYNQKTIKENKKQLREKILNKNLKKNLIEQGKFSTQKKSWNKKTQK